MDIFNTKIKSKMGEFHPPSRGGNSIISVTQLDIILGM